MTSVNLVSDVSETAVAQREQTSSLICNGLMLYQQDNNSTNVRLSGINPYDKFVFKYLYSNFPDR
jgi:hypothetical protein